MPCRPFAFVVLWLAMHAACASRSLAAPERPDPGAIADRYVTATGGVDALAREHGVHRKGRLHSMRLDGTIELWHAPPDRIAQEIRLGSLRFRTGFDGRQGWRTDLTSKQVTPLDGKDLEQIQADAYFENEMWAREGRGGGTLTLGPSSFRAGKEYVAVDVTPPVGDPRRLWFDTKSGRLVRWIVRHERRDSDTWFSEFETLGGRLRPTVHDALDPSLHGLVEPGALEREWTDSVAAFDDTTVYAPPSSQIGLVAWGDTVGVSHVPFRFGSRHVWVKVSINGAPPADFLLDTGASVTAIDVDYAASIGLIRQGEFSVQGIGGRGAASFAKVNRIRVGGARKDGVALRDFRVAILPLADGDEVLWRRPNGLLGADFLSQFVLDLDYPRQTVTFRAPEGYTYRGTGASLDMKLVSGIPVVTAEIDGHCGGDFLVDVGNGFGLLLHGAQVRSCGAVRATADRKQIKVYGGGVGSAVATWMTRVDSLTLGPFTIPQPIVGLTLATQGMVGSKALAGNIGSSVLQRFRCTFDYARRKLYLEPGADMGEPDRYSRTGAMLLRQAQRVVVAEVLHGSPADDAGLKPGLEITEIDGKPASSYTSEGMDRLFVDGKVGSTCKLTVVEDGKTKRVTLTLRDVI